MVDLSRVAESDLAQWARSRIAADARELESLGIRAGVIAEGDTLDSGLNFDLGTLAYRDGDAMYVLGPHTFLVGQTRDGREMLWRDTEHGIELVYDVESPSAAED